MCRVVCLWVSVLLICVGCHQTPSLRTAEGKTIALSQYDGKWIIVSYWAQWCHQCQVEMPRLNAYWHAHQQQVAIIGVDFDHHHGMALRQAVRQLNIDFPVIDGSISPWFSLPNPSVLPVSYLFGPDHHLRKLFQGPQLMTYLAEHANGPLS